MIIITIIIIIISYSYFTRCGTARKGGLHKFHCSTKSTLGLGMFSRVQGPGSSPPTGGMGGYVVESNLPPHNLHLPLA